MSSCFTERYNISSKAKQILDAEVVLLGIQNIIGLGKLKIKKNNYKRIPMHILPLFVFNYETLAVFIIYNRKSGFDLTCQI